MPSIDSASVSPNVHKAPPAARNVWEQMLVGLKIGLGSEDSSYVISQLRQLVPMDLTGSELTLGVVDLFFRDWVDEHYGVLMLGALKAVLGTPGQIRYENVGRSAIAAAEASGAEWRRGGGGRLNEKFNFESYVVSESNQLPAAAAYAVADAPGRAYNPLFIYGGTGLGKTHLLHAIGNRVQERDPTARCLYLSSEEFTNQFIESLRDHQMTAFRTRFREECDVLLIDDIQFLGKKQETQNEFFYTFNALHQMSKAVVMTSDTVPSEIPGLEERLRSRFAMGLITDVQGPNFEARVAILKKKAERDGLDLPDKVAQFIARSIVTNVRELEGALIKVMAVHTLNGAPLSEELCREVLRDSLGADRSINAEAIQREVSKYYRIPVDELRGERRVRDVVHARQVAMYFCRQLTSASLPEIGRSFDKDHSTVLSSIRKIERRKGGDEQLRLELGALGTKLSGP